MELLLLVRHTLEIYAVKLPARLQSFSELGRLVQHGTAVLRSCAGSKQVW
jgi:hypothetical protein